MSNTKIKRQENWEQSLHQFFEKTQDEPFQWGKNDCCLFANRAIHAMTGENLAEPYKTDYHNAKGAYQLMQKILKQKDFNHHQDFVRQTFKIVAKQNNLAACDTNFLQRGDVALIRLHSKQQTPLQYALGIVDLSGMFVKGVAPAGSIRLPLSFVQGGWHI